MTCHIFGNIWSFLIYSSFHPLPYFTLTHHYIIYHSKLPPSKLSNNCLLFFKYAQTIYNNGSHYPTLKHIFSLSGQGGGHSLPITIFVLLIIEPLAAGKASAGPQIIKFKHWKQQLMFTALSPFVSL